MANRRACSYLKAAPTLLRVRPRCWATKERRLGAPLLGGMEVPPRAGAAPGKQYVLFDQFGSRGAIHCESPDCQPKLLARYDASSNILHPRACTGDGMLEMVCGGGRREQQQKDTLVELLESRRPEGGQASGEAQTTTSSSSWHENSQEIEALMMESDVDDEDGSVTSGLAHTSTALGDQSDGEGSVASGAEQRFWDDSLLSVCRASAPRGKEVSKTNRIRRRMKTLRSWVPGGNKLDTIRVLEEVIRYIRSSQQHIEKNILY